MGFKTIYTRCCPIAIENDQFEWENSPFLGLPSGNLLHIAIEHCHRNIGFIYPLQMVIFISYVSFTREYSYCYKLVSQFVLAQWVQINPISPWFAGTISIQRLWTLLNLECVARLFGYGGLIENRIRIPANPLSTMWDQRFLYMSSINRYTTII